MPQICLVLAFFVIISCSASMPSMDRNRNSILKCKSGKDERLLEIVSTEAGGCELSYSKFGDRKIIATSIQGLNHCEKVMQKTRSALENSKFLCA